MTWIYSKDVAAKVLWCGCRLLTDPRNPLCSSFTLASASLDYFIFIFNIVSEPIVANCCFLMQPSYLRLLVIIGSFCWCGYGCWYLMVFVGDCCCYWLLLLLSAGCLVLQLPKLVVSQSRQGNPLFAYLVIFCCLGIGFSYPLPMIRIT